MEKKPLYTIHQYKNNIKRIENEKLSNQPLFIYTLLVYFFFGSVNQAGKVLLAGSYNSRLGIHSWNVYQTLGNLTWFFFFLTSPITLQYIPQVVMKVKFRAILFVGSLGPQILLLVPYYSQSCMQEPELICKETVIYGLAFIISSIGGVLQGVLFVGLLFYFINISSGEEKILYLGGFGLIYNFIWVTGALSGGLIMFIVDSKIQEYYAIILVTQFVFSLFFLFVPELNSGSRIYSIKKKLKSLSYNQNTSQQVKTNINEDATVNGNLQQNLVVQSLGNVNLMNMKQKLENVTLQCFSLEEEDLNKVLNGSFSQVNLFVTIQEQDQKNTEILDKFDQLCYFDKMAITWRQLGEQKFYYLIPSILAICYIQVSVLLYLYKLVNIQDKQVQNTLTCYGYYGLGLVIGLFIVAIVGDIKDKIRLIMGLLIMMQFGVLIGALSIHWKYYAFTNIFSLIMGFCESGILSTILTIITYQYVYVIFFINKLYKHIYMFDMLYFIYNFGLSFAALTLIVCDYSFDQSCIIFLSCVGIIAIITIGFYFKSLKL